MAEVPEIVAFRRIIDDQVTEFVNASRHFNEPLTRMAYMVKRAFELELTFIITGCNSYRPDNAKFSDMIEPLSGVLREIQEFRDRNRHNDEFFNHLSTVSESLVALSWIGAEPLPVPFIRDMRDAGDYFGNRVLSTNKGNQRHQTWINKWNDILKALEQYVKEYHLTGFNWGVALRGIKSGGSGAPPPPPPPPVCDYRGGGGEDRHALLSQINQGLGITQMLHPIGLDAAIHSKRLAAAAAAAAVAAAGAGDADAAAAAATAAASVPHQLQLSPAVRTYPPKFTLEGQKWRVEHQKDDFSLTIDNDEMSQSLAMFKCQNVGLEVRNKMNGVSIDNCKRSTIVLKDIISSVELIRCENVKVQCSGHVPLVSLDNCDSIQVFLTDRSIDAEVISSKSSSLNVCLMAPDGDYTELAVPEQIRTVVMDRRLISTVVEKI